MVVVPCPIWQGVADKKFVRLMMTPMAKATNEKNDAFEIEKVSTTKEKGGCNKVFYTRVNATQYSFLWESFSRKGNCNEEFTLLVQN